jgi:serine/threonine protein kinase
MSGSYYDEKIDMWSTGCVLYFMLVGQKPFENKNVAKLNDMILKGKFSKNDDNWSTLSCSARDLIEKLIQINPLERLSSTEALSHSWFTYNSTPKAVVVTTPNVSIKTPASIKK